MKNNVDLWIILITWKRKIPNENQRARSPGVITNPEPVVVEYVLVATRLWLNNITQDDSVCVKSLFDWHFAAGM